MEGFWEVGGGCTVGPPGSLTNTNIIETCSYHDHELEEIREAYISNNTQSGVRFWLRAELINIRCFEAASILKALK